LLARGGFGSESLVENQPIGLEAPEPTEDLLWRGGSNVQISQSQRTQPRGQDQVGLIIAIVDVVFGISWRDAHTDSVSTDIPGGGTSDFDDYSCAFFSRPAVCIGAVVRTWRQKLSE